MQLTDHIQHLLRDHDCVIIPDFGGLIADYEPARLHPVRHTLAPPAKRVAFNQALTRNDGLLVDAISRTQQLTPGVARQQVREAVQRMQQELDEQQRTELPGIGIFRSLPGRGLDFEYTGHQNLLPASFGLPELTSRPVRATDALQARERSHQAPQPTLAPARRKALRRVLNGVLGASAFGLFLAANLQLWYNMGGWPEGWWWPTRSEATASAPAARPQAASLAQPWTEEVVPDGTPEATPEISKPAVVAVPKKAAATKVATTASVAATTKAAVEGKAAAEKPLAATPAGARLVGVTHRWHVVTGSFAKLTDAAQVQQNYVHKGKIAQVMKAGWYHGYYTRWYRVSVADFSDEKAAKASLPTLRKQFGNQIIVQKY